VNADAAWEVDPEELPPSKQVGGPRLIHEVLWFTSFTHATEISLYTALLLCVLGLLWQIQPLRQGDAVRISKSPLRLPGEFSKLYEPAEEMCRAFEFQLLHAEHCNEPAQFWLFPL
jgi:hypothetical protein